MLGKVPDTYWQKTFMESAKKEQAFLDTQEKMGVTLDSRIKGMFTPNDQDTNAPDDEPDDEPDDTNDEPEQDDEDDSAND